MTLLRFLLLGAVISCASSESLDARLGAIESKVKSLEAIHANKEVKAAFDWAALAKGAKEACTDGAPAMCSKIATFAKMIPSDKWSEDACKYITSAKNPSPALLWVVELCKDKLPGVADVSVKKFVDWVDADPSPCNTVCDLL